MHIGQRIISTRLGVGVYVHYKVVDATFATMNQLLMVLKTALAFERRTVFNAKIVL